MSYFTLKNGEKLYYEDVGSGSETLVMMHGWTSSHEIFVEPAEKLKDTARCIYYDHRGHSGSKDANREKPTMETLAGDLNELIEGLGLSDITLLGWSMGAGVAMNYVRIYGCGKLKRIVLCDMTPKQINDGEWRLGLDKGAYTNKELERDSARDFFSIYRDFAVGAVPRLKKIPGFLLKKPLGEILAKCDEGVLRSLSASMKSQDLRDVIGQITVPLTYFYADPGSLFTPKLAEWYGQQVKTPYKAVRFPDSDHMLVSNDPNKFAECVAEVLKNS